MWNLEGCIDFGVERTVLLIQLVIFEMHFGMFYGRRTHLLKKCKRIVCGMVSNLII